MTILNDTKNKKRNESNIILYLGSLGFPFGSATIQRQTQISKALQLAGFHVIVLNRRSGHSKLIADREQIKKHDFFQGIEYYYTSLISYRSDNFIFRNLNRLVGYINEFVYLVHYAVFRKAKYMFVRTEKISTLRYYFYLSRMLNLEVIYDYVELYDAMGKRDIYNRDELAFKFDYKFQHYTDKVVVISAYLENHVKKIDPNKKTIKIPPIIDFDLFDAQYQNSDGALYFLFCGYVGYSDTIFFIIDAYERSNARHKDVKLELILRGDQNELEEMKNYIQKRSLAQNIILSSNLSYTELIKRYKNALALLIPIMNNIQDQARIPFKICEYAAAGRPIISMATESTLSYFQNGKEALLSEVNSINDYVKSLNFICDNIKKSDEIGLNGYKKGKDIFNYKSYAQGLKEFLN